MLQNLESKNTLSKNYHNLNLRQLGLCEYAKVWQEMKTFTDMRKNNKNMQDEIWHLQHYPVFTLGQAGKLEHIIKKNDIPLVKSDRGGQITYHGPGQLVSYLLIDLKRKNIGIKKVINNIEESIINYLSRFNIKGHRIDNAPGIYVTGTKICSIGLRVRNGCTYHGIAFNINMDLTPFSYINPCGYKGLRVTQLKNLGGPDSPDAVIPLLTEDLACYLGYH